ncbi:MAG: DnaB-like helicase C-terminal domain-containing protein [Promethearchaeota archaeon]
MVQAVFYTYGISQGKRLLTDDHYRSLLIEQGGKGDITIAMQVYHDCMYGVHYSNTKENFDLLKRQLIDAVVHRKGLEALKKFNENVPKMGYLEATRQFQEELGAAVDFTIVKKSAFMTLDEVKQEYLSRLEAKMHEKEELIKCKIPEIDEAMNVGFKPGHTTLVVAATGCHKTNLMLNIALNIFGRGHNVLFLPLEMDWEDFVNRIIANVADISYKNLLNPKLLTQDEYKKVKEAKAWLDHNDRKFALLDVDEQISVPVLRREIERRANYFKPRLVVVDYLGLLKTQLTFGQRHDLALGELTKDLKFMGKKFGFHILTAAQLGRADIKRLREEGSEAQLDSTAVKGSQEVSADVEFIIALTKVLDEDDRLKLHWIKSRYGPSGFTNDLRLDADKCQISSMKPSQVAGGLESDVIGDDWLNEPVEQIAQKVEEYQGKPVQFASMDPDDLDDVIGM